MILTNQSLYREKPEVVAKKILGMVLVRKYQNTIVSGRIVETEAYLANEHPASHSFNGRTKRNEAMFGDAGQSYVYSIHRYNCVNVVTEVKGVPSAVLIRALEPLSGIEVMRELRNVENIKRLCSGPGKLCQALHITKEDNMTRLFSDQSSIQIASDHYKHNSIVTTTRVGISKAKELPLRFYLAGNQYISRK